MRHVQPGRLAPHGRARAGRPALALEASAEPRHASILAAGDGGRPLHQLGRQPVVHAGRDRRAAQRGGGAGGPAGRRERALRGRRPLVQPGARDRRHAAVPRTGCRASCTSTGRRAASWRCPARPSARSASRSGTPGWRSRTRATSTARRIAGAIATATHGSGLELPSFSATLRRAPPRARVRRRARDRRGRPAPAGGAGRRSDCSACSPRSRSTAVPAYRMAERIEHWTWDEAFARFDEHGARPPPLLVLLVPVGGVGRAVRPHRAAGRPRRGQLLREDLRRRRRGRAGRDDAGRPRRPAVHDLPGRVRAQLPRARVLRAVRARRARRSRRCAS